MVNAIKSIICKTMPETAAASGFCSLVDTTSKEVARLMAAHFETIYAMPGFDVGVNSLKAWLTAQGETCTGSVVLDFRKAIGKARMFRNSAIASPIVFADTRAAQHAEAMAEWEAMQDVSNTECD